MKEPDYKINLPEDRSQVYVCCTDPFSKHPEDNNFAICVTTKGERGKQDTVILGQKVISYIGRTYQERQLLVDDILKYYDGCTILVETGEMIFNREKNLKRLREAKPIGDYTSEELELKLFGSHENVVKFKEESQKMFNEYLTEGATNPRPRIPFEGILDEWLKLRQ